MCVCVCVCVCVCACVCVCVCVIFHYVIVFVAASHLTGLDTRSIVIVNNLVRIMTKSVIKKELKWVGTINFTKQKTPSLNFSILNPFDNVLK